MADTYKVKQGDTLWSIAKQRGIPLQKLLDANPGLDDPNLINPGMELSFEGSPTAPGISKKQWVERVSPYWNRTDLQGRWANSPNPRVSVEELADWAWESLPANTAKYPHMKGYEDEALELMMNQLVQEGAGPGAGRSSRNNPGNVGEEDTATKMTFDSPGAGLNAMLDLISRAYVRPGRSPDELLTGRGGYTRHDTGNRYARDPNYEKALQQIRSGMRGKFNYPVGNLVFE